MKGPSPPPAFISPTDLAARWDYSIATVKGWCKQGLIPGASKVGAGAHSSWRIPLAWVAQGERKTTLELAQEITEARKERKKARSEYMGKRLPKNVPGVWVTKAGKKQD